MPPPVEQGGAQADVLPSPAVPADPSPTRDGLGRIAARGAGVTLAGQGARILLQLASVAVLARLLDPRDYGLFAVGLVVVGIGEVVRDLGLSTAAIRAPSLTRLQRDGLFWLNTAAGVVLALVAVVAAEPVAAAFGEPQLVPVIRFLAVTFLLNGLVAQYRAGLTRDLRFGALAGTDLLAQVLALTTAVVTAVLGAGYWALVAQQLTQGAVVLVTAVALARWRPGRPQRGAGLRPFLRFGGGVTGTQLVYHLGNNLDNIALGLWAGPVALGVYNRGYQVLMNPLNQVRAPASNVAIPVLARLQEDPARSDEYLRRGQLALGYTLVAGMAVVAGTAVPLVALLLGDRWAAVSPVLTLLAVAGSAQTLAYVGNWVYLARGLSGALLRYTLVTLLLSAVCIGIGSRWGVVGVAAGYAAAAALEWPLSLWWLSRVTVIPVRALLLGALRVSACAVAAGGAAFLGTELVSGAHPGLRILAGVAGGLAVYAAAAALPVVRADLCGVAAWARSMAGRGR